MFLFYLFDFVFRLLSYGNFYGFFMVYFIGILELILLGSIDISMQIVEFLFDYINFYNKFKLKFL